MRFGHGVVAAAVWALISVASSPCPAAESPPEPPSPRAHAEVEAVLRVSPPPPATGDLRTLRVLLVAGLKTHGPLQHDYPVWQRNWAALLAQAPAVSVDTAFPWPEPTQWDAADVAVFYLRNAWTPEQLDALARFQARGGGVVSIHWAIGADDTSAGLAQRLGLAYPRGQYRHGPVEMALDAPHPITQGFPPTVALHDEAYWPFAGDQSRVTVLATSQEVLDAATGATGPVPLLWTHEPAGGRHRVFVTILGHYMWTFDDPLARLLLLRGIAWAAREPVTRLDALCLLGARVGD